MQDSHTRSTVQRITKFEDIISSPLLSFICRVSLLFSHNVFKENATQNTKKKPETEKDCSSMYVDECVCVYVHIHYPMLFK